MASQAQPQYSMQQAFPGLPKTLAEKPQCTDLPWVLTDTSSGSVLQLFAPAVAQLLRQSAKPVGLSYVTDAGTITEYQSALHTAPTELHPKRYCRTVSGRSMQTLRQYFAPQHPAASRQMSVSKDVHYIAGAAFGQEQPQQHPRKHKQAITWMKC